MDEATGQITRMRIRGEEVLETKTIARYDAETQTLFFPDKKHVELYKQGAVTFLVNDEKNVRHFQRDDLKLDDPTAKIPPRPKKNKHEGDKTEAVVEWYMKYRNNEFETRYGVLGTYTGLVAYRQPLWEPRPKDGVPEFRGEQKWEKEVRDALVTLRKTHLSYTPEECVDWDPDAQNDDAGDDNSAPVFVPAGRRSVAKADIDDDDGDAPIKPGARGGKLKAGSKLNEE